MSPKSTDMDTSFTDFLFAGHSEHKLVDCRFYGGLCDFEYPSRDCEYLNEIEVDEEQDI